MEAVRSLKGSPVTVRAQSLSFFSWPWVKQFTPSGIKSGPVPTQVLINRINWWGTSTSQMISQNRPFLYINFPKYCNRKLLNRPGSPPPRGHPLSPCPLTSTTKGKKTRVLALPFPSLLHINWPCPFPSPLKISKTILPHPGTGIQTRLAYRD